MPEDDRRPARPDIPSELPNGVTIADLPDEEIQRRARFVAALFDHMTTTLRDFIAAGCPLEESELLRLQATNALELSHATFRGATEWRESREEAVKQAIAAWKVSGAKDANDVPSMLTAALLCDVALESEDEFLDLVRRNGPALRAVEAREAPRSADRSRLN